MASLVERARLLRGLLSGRTAYAGPFYVTVDVTRRCNLHCPGCRYHSSMIEPIHSPGDLEIRDLPVDLFSRVCADLRAMGTESLVLIAEGEPLLHPHVFELIDMAKQIDLHVTLLTNGTLLDNRRARALVASGLDLLKVSLWGSSREEYEQNYPGSDPGNFVKVVHGLQRISQAKAERGQKLPLVTLHQPINQNNCEHIEAMVNLAQATGCEGLSFSPFKTRRGRLSALALSPHEERHICKKLGQMRERLDGMGMRHNIDSTLLRYRIGELVWQRLPCYIGWHQVRIKVDGTVQPCSPCDLPVGNLNEQSLQEVWNGEALKAFREQTCTREGLMAFSDVCDCGFCCHLEDNWRVHKLMRWVKPLRALFQMAG